MGGQQAPARRLARGSEDRCRERMGAMTPEGAGPEAAADADGDSIMGSPPEREAREGPRPRRYCPVQGCPESICTRAQGWTDPAALRKHMECHVSGRITGTSRGSG